MSTDLALYEQLNKELVSLVEHFTTLVKATREGLEADESTDPKEKDDKGGSAAAAAAPAAASRSERRVPGELLEVVVEKLLAAGHQCIHTVSQLKKSAMVSDFATLMGNVHAVQQRLTSDTYHTTRGLEHIKRDAENLLAELEQHYYSSSHKGPLPSSSQQQGSEAQPGKLAELCAQALQMTAG
ncbi:hypothetical protein OEZ85_012901 [Tetradesmus obliquus]|uniref:Mediator of RNA polymerase II transcription subunit 11 n=1 Tax=Tetradesmus obliquus TaxID=3088 RepID=A0ABY8U968_TETOB|nr:hypothetical protein OEZ85_012901 [Tetradesmus obliquus]